MLHTDDDPGGTGPPLLLIRLVAVTVAAVKDIHITGLVRIVDRHPLKPWHFEIENLEFGPVNPVNRAHGALPIRHSLPPHPAFAYHWIVIRQDTRNGVPPLCM
jgi:hypothetical protein